MLTLGHGIDAKGVPWLVALVDSRRIWTVRPLTVFRSVSSGIFVSAAVSVSVAAIVWWCLVVGARQANAAPQSDAQRARSLVSVLAKVDSSDASPALEKSQNALKLAKERGLPPNGSEEHSLLLSRNALIWAQVARDTRRGRIVRQQANRLEEELSELRAQLSRTRAVVEQARARVGRATEALQEITAATPATIEGAQ